VVAPAPKKVWTSPLYPAAVAEGDSDIVLLEGLTSAGRE